MRNWCAHQHYATPGVLCDLVPNVRNDPETDTMKGKIMTLETSDLIAADLKNMGVQ